MNKLFDVTLYCRDFFNFNLKGIAKIFDLYFVLCKSTYMNIILNLRIVKKRIKILHDKKLNKHKYYKMLSYEDKKIM